VAEPLTTAPTLPRIGLRTICKHFGTRDTRVDALVDISLTIPGPGDINVWLRPRVRAEFL
jgi:hypothetical protein